MTPRDSDDSSWESRTVDPPSFGVSCLGTGSTVSPRNVYPSQFSSIQHDYIALGGIEFRLYRRVKSVSSVGPTGRILRW